MAGRRRPSLPRVLCLAVAGLASATLVHGYLSEPGQPASPVDARVEANGTGNSRPALVGYDGLMVRRCQAVALYPSAGASAALLSSELQDAADSADVPLVRLPADVLSPAALALAVPDAVSCLPATAGRLLGGRLAGEDHRVVEPVLFHDLAFTVRPAAGTTAALDDALDREGILADALGRYQVDRSAAGALVVRYSGPLLSDAEVEGVRAAIARPAGLTPAQVAVGPRSTSGVGVDMASEPRDPAEPATGATGHAGH